MPNSLHKALYSRGAPVPCALWCALWRAYSVPVGCPRAKSQQKLKIHPLKLRPALRYLYQGGPCALWCPVVCPLRSLLRALCPVLCPLRGLLRGVCGALWCARCGVYSVVPCGVPCGAPWCARGESENRRIRESENTRIRGYEDTRIREYENTRM